RDQAGGSRLAMRAGNGDAAAETHQLTQHFRARNHRNARFAGGDQFGIVELDRARRDHDIRIADMRGGMADAHVDTKLTQALRRRRFAAIRAGHGIAEVVQHLGDAAHAHAANADEMHAAESAHQVFVSEQTARRHAATSTQARAMSAAASGLASVRAASAMAMSLARSPSSAVKRCARSFVFKSRSWINSAAPAATSASALRVWWSSTACGNGTSTAPRPQAVSSASVSAPAR